MISILVVVLLLIFLSLYWRFYDRSFTELDVVNDKTPKPSPGVDIDEDKIRTDNVKDCLEESYESEIKCGDANPIDIYLAESERIRKVFFSSGEQLLKEAETVFEIEGRYVVDCKNWEKEYYQPLYREVKNAMARVLGTDDYLAIWENLTLVQEIAKINITIPYTYRTKFYRNEISLDLLTIYSLAILYENRENMLKDTIYEVSEINGQYRENNSIIILNTFPPQAFATTTFDLSWHIMTVYSFKNERSRKILYEIATNNIDDRMLSSLAGFATFYLSFFYDSSDLIPPLNERLETAFEQFYNQCPRSLKDQLEEKDAKDLTSGEFNNILEEFKKKHPIFNYDFIYSSSSAGSYLIRLLKLRDSLLFNEKIPSSERERFDIVRRELAISWALSNKRTILGPSSEVILKKGEEHFAEYLREYYLPPFVKYHFEEGE